MTQVIMLFFFPIGLYFYFFVEKKNRPKYQKTFDDFQINIKNNSTLNDEEKKNLYRDMLVKNKYKITQLSKTVVIGEKRIFSMSLFIMSLGLIYVGVIFYLLYYFFMQDAHVVKFEV